MTNVKLIIESLCESILISSNELRSILYKMRYSNDYANILFNMIYYNKDIKTNYNAISISDRNDEISFIPDSQHSKILQDGQDPWTKTKSKSKIGRAVRQILTSNGYTVTDSDIEKFVNSFKTAWDKEYAPKKIEIVKSDKIIYWYNEQNYSEEGGTLGNSCMRSASKGNYMRLYADNDDKISMVVLIDGSNKLLARALLWKLDKSDKENAKYYLDRIYVRNDSDYETMYNWAVENVVKGDKSLLLSHKMNDNNHNKMIVDLKKVVFEEYPYADSFFYIYKKLENGKLSGDGFISNRNVQEDFPQYVGYSLQDTSGGESIFTHKYSKVKEKFLSLDDAIYIDSIRDYVEKEDCEYSNYLSKHILKEEAVYSEKMKDWIPKSKSFESKKFGLILRDIIINVITKYNGPDDPFDAYSKFLNNDEDVEEEELLKTDVGSYFRSRTSEYNSRYFSRDFRVNDINGYEYANIICYKFYKVENYKEITTQVYFNNWSSYYISKEESEYYNMKIDESDSKYILAESIIERYDSNFYIDALYGEHKNKTEEQIKSYQSYLEKIHNIKMKMSRRYKEYFEINSLFLSKKINPMKLTIKILTEFGKEYFEKIKKYVLERYRLKESELPLFNNLCIIFFLHYMLEYSHSDSKRWLMRLNDEYYEGKISTTLISAASEFTYNEIRWKLEEALSDGLLAFRRQNGISIDTSTFRDNIIRKLNSRDINSEFSNIDISGIQT